MRANNAIIRAAVSYVLTVQFSYFGEGEFTCQILEKIVFTLLLYIVEHHIVI